MTFALILGGSLIYTLIELIVVLAVLGVLLRVLGVWGGGPRPGPTVGSIEPVRTGWGYPGGAIGALISVIVFLVIVGVLLRILGVVL